MNTCEQLRRYSSQLDFQMFSVSSGPPACNPDRKVRGACSPHGKPPSNGSGKGGFVRENA